MNPRFAFVLAALLLLLPVVAKADLDAGVRAYRAGDYSTAFREWWAAAEGGDARAQVRLGGLYEKGLGVERNVVEAHRWYDLAAAAGNAEAAAARDALAIRAFQRSAGMTVDGRPSQPLLARLETAQASARRRSSNGSNDADQRKLVGAIIDGDAGEVRRLVAGGRVDVNDVRTVGASKWSVLRQSVVQPKASPEMVTVLLEAGADPNVPPHEWSGPPLTTVKSPLLVKALVDAGADVNWVNGASSVLAKHVLNCKMAGAEAYDNVAILLAAGATVTPEVRDLAFNFRDPDPACAKVYGLISNR